MIPSWYALAWPVRRGPGDNFTSGLPFPRAGTPGSPLVLPRLAAALTAPGLDTEGFQGHSC
ncbi:hypothetical protein E2C01_047049 [Portunus trituberculatus]|uniref:Uncharacterized protein n=1 Tax=Portunus trituberculatus TaxID=210409 RepID=A0A5B7G7I6_PORTR|nr:hypothetical protein [Portunus trituberculatus]